MFFYVLLCCLKVIVNQDFVVVVLIGQHVDLVDEAGPVSELLAKVSLLTEVGIADATGVKLLNGMIAVLTYCVVREPNLILLPDHLFFVEANPRK